MGKKSRDNFNISFCMKTDCRNRCLKCDICLFYDQYEIDATKIKGKEDGSS